MFLYFIHTIRPLFLLSVILFYVLGIGIAQYDGAILNWDLVILGLLWLILIQFGVIFLQTYFNDHLVSADAVRDSGDSTFRLSGSKVLFLAFSFLAAGASLAVLFIRSIGSPTVFLLMIATIFGALSYAVPPIRLEYSGFGELLLSLLVSNLVPAFSYEIQGGDSLRLLAMVTFPLTSLYLAMLLAFSLSTYAGDVKFRRRTLMIRMGWQNGILFHNILVLCAYLFLALAVTFGLPWQIGAPALLTLPVGLLQIWTVNRIAAGGKPRWYSLKLMSGALLAITTYLLAFGFLIR